MQDIVLGTPVEYNPNMSQFLDSLKDRFINVEEDFKINAEISKSEPSKLKSCLICGKPFVKQRRAVYCGRKHFTTCLNCGKSIEITSKHYYGVAPKTCCKACADTLGVQTYKENAMMKYGVTNPMLVPELAAKMVSKRNPDFDISLKTEKQIRNCAICGKEFEFNYLSPKKCCSKECSGKLREHTIQSNLVICRLCGKEFTPQNNSSVYCSGPHYRKCEICGVQFMLKTPTSKSTVCSNRCRQIKREQTNSFKYGTKVVSQNSTIKVKLRDAYYSSSDQRVATCLRHYDTVNPAQSTEVRDKISATVASVDCQTKITATCMEKYGVPHSSAVPEIHQKSWNTRKGIVADDGTKLDSSWEKLVYEFWTGLGLEVERNIPITFEYNGKQHTTFIDFRVNGLLCEVKGKPYLDGVFDYKQSVPIERKLEVYREHHVILITNGQSKSLFGHKDSKESNGLKHLDVCPNPLIGVDIELFDDNPEFPYSPNKPKCFYDVSVNGRPSQYDAFYDKKLRWEIIKNRIQYVGGYIDSKEILVGLNVTRKAKQPSWFSKAYARKLIEKYCTTGIIVDPFAGWGTRHDATVALHKQYIGCDANAELVDWHKSQGRLICHQDARDFKYTGECSVLICPPYSDTEVYFTGQSNLTESEWLDIVMQNVPNACEYIMVCHEVSDKYAPFVVDTKLNSSHLNNNTEYVVVIKSTDLLSLCNK